MNRIAAIDLGTNNFNIIIAEKNKNEINYLFKHKVPVKLGNDGIKGNTITDDGINRSLNTLKEFKKTAIDYNVSKIIAAGTSIFRTSKNTDYFLRIVKKELDIDIQIISGDKEAQLIYLGIKQTITDLNENFLIIDIGGGSNELIIADNKMIHWKKSYPVGIARLNSFFATNDPITESEILKIENYLSCQTNDFIEYLNTYKPKYIIGAEGAFESFIKIANENFSKKIFYDNSKAVELPNDTYFQILNLIIKSNSEQLKNLKGLDYYRVDMIVKACIFINYMVKTTQLNKIFVSPFSLKEGMVWEYFINY